MRCSVDEWFEGIIETGAQHCMVWADAASGLRALLVLDDTTLGPGVGGTRTQPYHSVGHALADATWLSRAMTEKCALANLNAGGAKLVVLEHPRMDREAAFLKLGEKIDALGGLFWTGPDLGTHQEDLDRMRAGTRHVRTDALATVASVARGVLRGIEACVDVRGTGSLAGLRVAIQGCGGVGAALARTLAEKDVEILVADVDKARAAAVAEEVGAKVIAAEDLFTADVDVISPCAGGGVLSTPKVEAMHAWAVCGGANNVLANMAAAEAMRTKEILFVPDIVSTSGGVIHGIGRDVMAMEDPTPLIDRIRELTRDVLEGARSNGRNTMVEARARARTRIDAKKTERAQARMR